MVLLVRGQALCHRAVSQHEQGGQLVGGALDGDEGALGDEVSVGVQKVLQE